MKAQCFKVAIAFLVTLAISEARANATHPAVPGEYVVKFKKAALPALKQQIQAQSSPKQALDWIHPETGWAVIERPKVELQSFALNDLNSNPLIEYAEPNYIYQALRIPNDPQFLDLWGLENRGLRNPSRVGIDIDAVKAWDISVGSKNVVVAVIDTGIDYTQFDLAPNMWTNSAELNGRPGIDDDGNGFIDDIYGYNFSGNIGDPMDDNNHGSHCAGTIGAKGDDGFGIPGVNWNVSLMAVKFLDSRGAGNLDDAVRAIDYAAAMGAHVMSNSWGGGPFSQAMKEAIERAEAKGISFIAAAGNHAGNNDTAPTYPASYDIPSVISVAAMDPSGNLARFSCYGKSSVHVAAPGVDVVSTTPEGYKSFSGTSMATPHVAGVAALLLANEALSPLELKQRLMASARPLATLHGRVASNGMVNAYHALMNTRPDNDPNDPAGWLKSPRIISSEHPYSDNIRVRYSVYQEGAARIAIYFARFETEATYDKVTFMDKAGKVYGEYSGDHSGRYSPVVEGDTVIMEFVTDSSVTGYGFDIREIAYQETEAQTH